MSALNNQALVCNYGLENEGRIVNNRDMRRYRYGKIVATLGPASNTEEKIAALFKAGVDVFRLNFSHGTHEDHKKIYNHIRKIEKEFKRPIAIIADLQGPKLRIGKLEDLDVVIEAGQKFTLDKSDVPGTADRVMLPHPELFEVLKKGDEVLIYDGKIRLQVEKVTAKEIVTKVTVGGKLTSYKGVNVPNISLPFSSLTTKDKKDLKFALELEVDWIALSFVQRPEDIKEARKLVKSQAHIITKLEKPSAIDTLQEVVDLSDGVMIARGDLGVEIPLEEVPSLQKRIIRHCRDVGKPVIVATQMLDSMVKAPSPTRAEASDVATAVYDGADAVMLSEETAAGKYPVETVEMMNKIITRVEADPLHRTIMNAHKAEFQHTEAEAISASANIAAKAVEATAIITYTTGGRSAIVMARQRPVSPVLSITGRIETARYLSLLWGVHSVKAHDARDFEEMIEIACKEAVANEFGKVGDRLIVTAGTPFGTPGATNVLRIAVIGDEHAA